MIILHRAEIKISRGIYCSRKCEHLAFVAAYCDLFKQKLHFIRTRYERCAGCRIAENKKF